MARPVRIDVPGGWYHTMARGTERRTLFRDDRDSEHFLALLGRMSERYGVGVHAYVLMGNHYHLLIESPAGNCSQAMQWLNVSYSVWFNRRQSRVGHVFQGRFGSALIEGHGDWLLTCSTYLHLNPVRVTALGLGKRLQRAEARGMVAPTTEQAAMRLALLRAYVWSSYGAYAGYRAGPEWLVTKEILRRSGGRNAYRERVEGLVSGGVAAPAAERLKGAVAIGAQSFVRDLKRRVKGLSREQPARSAFARLVPLEAIIRIVEEEKQESWQTFRDRHGDWGRDLVLLLARQRSGQTLAQLGQAVGGLDYKVAGKAIRRLEARAQHDRRLRALLKRCRAKMTNDET